MPPIASFTVGTQFYTVNVNASASTSDVAITSYDWNWGDGLIGAGMITSHTYAQSGCYTVTLTVTDVNLLTNSTTWTGVCVGVIENQYRYALETLTSPWPMALNPSYVHGHDSVYIYRILPLPATIELAFQASGPSYVEVYDADNDRFLLQEKTEITQDTTFNINWDGLGVFEVRVWMNSSVTGINLNFTLPDDQIIQEIKPETSIAPWVLVAGVVIASATVGLKAVLGGKR